MKIATVLTLSFTVFDASSTCASEEEPRQPLSIPYDEHSVPEANKKFDRIEIEQSFPWQILFGSTIGCLTAGGISLLASAFNPLLFFVTYSILTTAGATIGAGIGALLSNRSLPNVLLFALPGAIASLAAPLVFVGGIFWYFQDFSLTGPIPSPNALLVASAALYFISGPLVVFFSTWSAN